MVPLIIGYTNIALQKVLQCKPNFIEPDASILLFYNLVKFFFIPIYYFANNLLPECQFSITTLQNVSTF